MNTSEVLNKAADLIEERGWVKGNAGMIARPTGPVCLEGSIGHTIGLDTHLALGLETIEDGTPMLSHHVLTTHPAYKAVHDYLAIERPELWWWNDRLTSVNGDNLTDDQASVRVIATLRAAALIEAAKENAAAEVSEQVSA